MTWNYRMTVETCDDEDVWALREVYYDDDGNVTSWSKDPVTPIGTSWREFADELSRMSGVIGQLAFDLDTKAWCDRRRKPREAP